MAKSRITANVSTVEVKGMTALLKALDELPNNIEQRMLKDSLHVAVGPIYRRAKATLDQHVLTGRLTGSLKVMDVTPKRRNITEVGVAAGDFRLFHRTVNPYWLEFGTAAHHIQARKAGALRLHGNKMVMSVEHPGAKAFPYMRPAFDGGYQEALDILGRMIHDHLEQYYGRIPASKILGLGL